ncbi:MULTISPECIES: nitroreductase family deazaflavin-dependent oxidoreductase [unclassified Geodermatophilus]
MGLARDLGYGFHPANPVQRATQAVVASRPGAWVFARVLPTVDDWIGRISRGRTSAPELLAGLPVVDVTTTGRRSGRRRTTHLIAVPHRDTLALVGTNFGQPATPDWVLNLEADPRATVTYRHRSVEVVARPAGDDEVEQVMANAAPLYRGYAAYRRRIGDRRRLRVFVLAPA